MKTDEDWNWFRIVDFHDNVRGFLENKSFISWKINLIILREYIQLN